MSNRNQRNRRRTEQRSAGASAKREAAGETSGDAKGSGSSKPGKALEAVPGVDLFPPVRHSLAHGLAAASVSPVVLVLPMLFVPALWLVLRAFGLEVFPPAMVQALSIPPISSSFDLIVATNMFGSSGVEGILFLLGLTVVRGLVWAILVGLLDEALEYRSVSRLGLLRGLNAFVPVAVYCYVSLGVMLLGNVVVQMLGPGIGSSISILSLVAGLMFLGFAPAISVRSGVPSLESLQRSIRAARLPGWPRHMMFVVLYFFLAAFIFPVFNPGFAVVTANPSVESVAYIFFGTFLNMVFLAGIIASWRALEDYVAPSPPRGRR